jgi:hypothetical protein
MTKNPYTCSLALAARARRYERDAILYGWRSYGPSVLTKFDMPDHIESRFCGYGYDGTPRSSRFHNCVAERVFRGEIDHGDLLDCKASILMVDLKLVDGFVALVPYDKAAAKDWLKFNNIKVPRPGKPAKLTEDQKFWFRMRFKGEELNRDTSY